MKWNKLSMADRAKYIALGVQQGITDLNSIRNAYNSYAEGGKKDRHDLEETLRDVYKDLYDRYPSKVVQDENFIPYGDDNTNVIETFIPRDNNPDYDRVIYNDNYTYNNPYPGQNTIVFNDVRDPKEATTLDYLHILRHKDPEYKVLLDNLMNASNNMDYSDIKEDADYFYNRDKEQKGLDNMDSYDTYLNNAADGWLRTMFHTGTKEEIEADNYNSDRQGMLERNAPLFEPTREIYNYLHPYTLPEVVVEKSKKK